ncbi:hypothetical protein [Peptoniphilus timonensis]|uniref:hypothetical protein n=1 Tax=Peptoniphilus timonensis TaxID=1268254 RepID=UPI000594746B|nr:hypothetical protein [Peptoniphilus timonensis]
MGKRHMLEIRRGQGLIYCTKLFNDGFNPGKEFYKNLKIDINVINGKSCEFEVDFTQLLLSWWRVVVHVTDEADLAKYIETRLMVNDTHSSQLESLRDTMIYDFFYDYNSLMDYSSPFEPNRLDSKYKAYLVIS